MEERRWSEAAATFELLAERARQRGDRSTAQQAWALAGDALRRDDRVAAGARALRRALDLLDRGDGAALERRGLAEVELASLLVQAGAIEAGATLCRERSAGPCSAGLRALALDGLCGARLLQGRLADALGAMAELEAVCPPSARPAVWFRRAAEARLGGDLACAQAHLDRVLAEAPAGADWAGPRAAAAEEQGELALLRGDLDRAASWLDDAARGWTAAGRRSALYRVEAASVRVQLTAGALPLAAVLDGPVEYAAERGLLLLEVELRRARGAARSRLGLDGASDLDLAVSLAEQSGAVLAEGYARFTRLRCLARGSEGPRLAQSLSSDRVLSGWLDRPGDAPW